LIILDFGIGPFHPFPNVSLVNLIPSKKHQKPSLEPPNLHIPPDQSQQLAVEGTCHAHTVGHSPAAYYREGEDLQGAA
jgi:hypothetical protein